MGKSNTNTETKEFVNPFAAGVSYSDFTKSLDGKTVEEYLTGKEKSEGELFTAEDIKWLTNELKAHAYNEENKSEFLKKANEENVALMTANEKK